MRALPSNADQRCGRASHALPPRGSLVLRTYGRRVPDAIFEHPRLASIYDALDGGDSDLQVYAAILDSLGVRTVADVGCGTGRLALLLAGRGLKAVGVDPAEGSLAVARAKPGADRVQWIHGDATALPTMDFDAVTMTGNVAQAITDPLDWEHTLESVRVALRPAGTLVFETRDPADRAWERWNRADSYAVTDVPAVGAVESWVELTSLSWPLITFRWTYVFASDGVTLTSDSTLRYREREEVERELGQHGYAVVDVRGAPDRPGRELVFLARRRA